MSIEIAEICRYPVKGLSAESLESVQLSVGGCLPHDRRFALAHGTSRYDSADPRWLPRTNFLMLARDERLAQLRVRFDENSGLLTLLRDGKQVVSGQPDDIMGRTLIGQFFAGFMAGSSLGTPKLVTAEGVAFTDAPDKWVSIINLASVRDLERVARGVIDPQRFRGNLYIESDKPWQEFGWVGQTLTLGEARLRVTQPIERCAATNVNPQSAERDLNIPLTLRKGYGHMNMGVYAEVVGEGLLHRGDRLVPPDP